MKIIWGAGNDKQGKNLRRAQLASSKTKLPSLAEDSFIHQQYHESFCFNYWKGKKGDLFDIGNGKAALGEKAKFLPNIWTTGFSACDCFIRDCNEDPNAGQNTIKRQKIKNFSCEAGSYKMSNKVESLDSVLMTRDLFGSILYHASQAQVDMEQILRDLLTLVPLSISDVGWTMQKTRTWKKSCIKFTCKCWSNHDWWYIIFSLSVPIPIYPCCRLLVEASFQTKRDGNSLGFWQNGLTLYKGCWKNQEIKPARYGLLDN